MKIFLDMDGVLADFDNAFVNTFGVDHRTGMVKKEMWRHVHSQPDFFLNLPLMSGANRLVEAALEIQHCFDKVEVQVLTAAPKSAYAHVAAQKIAWMHRHFGNHALRVIPTYGSESKPLFCQSPSDILVDDWGKNIDAWRAVGGKAIKHENAEQTIKELYELAN